MHRTLIKMFLIPCFVFSATGDLCAEFLTAKRRIETPLSNRIWGKWELNEELTADLRGRKSNLSAFAVAEFELIWPGQEFFDTPQEPVSADYTYYSRHDFFDTYLVWRSNKEDSINVALAKVSWEWGFYADATGGDWTASTGHTTLNGPITGAVGNSLPTWSKSRWVELDGEEGAPVENGGWKATSSPAPPPLPLPN